VEGIKTPGELGLEVIVTTGFQNPLFWQLFVLILQPAKVPGYELVIC
jgi:hypothetical protein